MGGSKHSGYGQDRRRIYRKGGGGSAKYDSLEGLYQEQADSARLLRQQAEKYLPDITDRYAQAVNTYLDPGFAQKQAGMAASDMAAANAMERSAAQRNLASMGVNPNDPRFAGGLRSIELNNAARMAAGQNTARNDAQKLQLAVAQDAVGTFTGQSNNAATQLGNASSGLGSVYANKANQKQNDSNNLGALIGGGIAAYSMFRDGGKVVERHAMGGTAGSQQRNQGFFQMQNIAPPPVAQAQQGGSPVGAALGAAGQVKQMTGLAGVGSAAAGTGAAMGTTAAANLAGATGGDALGTLIAGNAGNWGASAAGAGAGATALGAIGTALPWVGAAATIGSLLELWADGGEVGTQDIRSGGEVPGEWSGAKDDVPALLTKGEHVLNPEAAKLVGHSTLEKANKKGLALRDQGKPPSEIKTVGLEALA